MRRKSFRVAALVSMAGTMLLFGGCLGGGLRLFGAGLVAGSGFNLSAGVNGLLGLNALVAPPAAQ